MSNPNLVFLKTNKQVAIVMCFYFSQCLFLLYKERKALLSGRDLEKHVGHSRFPDKKAEVFVDEMTCL